MSIVQQWIREKTDWTIKAEIALFFLSALFLIIKNLTPSPMKVKISFLGTTSQMMGTNVSVTDCIVYLPCPGNPIEFCACKKSFTQSENRPLIADVSNLGNTNG